jgi:hypothetical protein
MEDFAGVVAVFFLGAIILAPVAALSARFAMKPVIALYTRRLAADDLATEVSEQARRIEALEAELADMQDSVKALTTATEFERRLAAPGTRIPSKAPPGS